MTTKFKLNGIAASYYEREDAVLDQMLSLVGTGTGVMIGGDDFALVLVMQGLIEREMHILHAEYPEVKPDEREFAMNRYAEARAKVEAKVGKDFDEAYQSARQTHNGCARYNLDQFEGKLYDWVLPKFNPDGTHDPLGDRDFPWGHYPEANPVLK